MKKTTILLSLIVMLFTTALAQNTEKPYSIVVHAAGGRGEFEGLVENRSTNHWVVAMGVDEKWSFSKRWALVLGLDYQYWYFIDYYVNGGTHNNEPPPDKANGHIIRLPVRFEHQIEEYYLALGALLEKGFGDRSEGRLEDILSLGPTVEVGGRIRLSEKSALRIGLQLSVGHTFSIGKYQDLECTRVETSLLLRIGYEYHL